MRDKVTEETKVTENMSEEEICSCKCERRVRQHYGGPYAYDRCPQCGLWWKVLDNESGGYFEEYPAGWPGTNWLGQAVFSTLPGSGFWLKFYEAVRGFLPHVAPELKLELEMLESSPQTWRKHVKAKMGVTYKASSDN